MPVPVIVAFEIETFVMLEPETNWIASYGLCWMRMSSTTIWPVMA